jgi:hypothetical protein
MMNTELQNDLPAETPNTDETAPAEKSWTLLYDRIRTLALRKSLSMLEEDETQGEEFDRGARALRTLMSAAEVSLRMKREEAKDTARHEPAREPEVTDDAIRALKRKLERQIERIEREDRAAAGRGDEGVLSPLLREGLGSECA